MDGGVSRVLVNSSLLRQLTVFLFYLCQGIPLGLFYLAIPAYMASAGATSGEIATVVAATGLPWSLKLMNGFIMDRYTYLPMGRRRAWIIGAQSLMVVGMMAGALLSPGGRDVFVLSALAFVISSATTFQDVAIDGLVIDIMTDEEQARSGGIMFGAQTLGLSGSTALSGWLIHRFGISSAYFACGCILAVIMLYVVIVREREGEKRLPWSKGVASPRNLDIQIEAWWPLLKESFRAILAVSSLMLIPFFFIRSIPTGGNEVYYPILTTTITGWETTDYTNVNSAATLASSIFGLVLGGWLVGKLGPRRVTGVMLALICALYFGIATMPEQWSSSTFMTGAIWTYEFVGLMYAVAMIPLAMQLCSPAVAATQFTIYMAIGNFGRPAGAWIAAQTTGGDAPETLFYTVAAIFAVAAVLIWFVRLPSHTPREQEIIEHKTAYGAGAAPVES